MLSMSESSVEDDTWISWFCSLKGNKLCHVDRSYIEDNFNLYGLRQVIPNYAEALNIILDRDAESDDESELSQQAMDLYGLIHARFIVTSRGLETMLKKYVNREFGTCPRVLCRGQPVVPAGRTDELHKDWLYLFCPKCQDMYHTRDENQQDGAYIGTTFAHLFFLTFPEFEPPLDSNIYVPRVFGYKIRKPNSQIVGPRKLALEARINSEAPSLNQTNAKDGAKSNANSGIQNGDDNVGDKAPEALPDAQETAKMQPVEDEESSRSKKRKSESQL